MSDLFEEPDDATPLQPAERDALRQSWITNRGDLNEAAQENIIAGAAWARASRRREAADLLTQDFVMSLHKRMLGDVWGWAGTFRRSEVNIGTDPHRIPAELPQLLDDARYWIEHQTYPHDEIAVRLHHRLVLVHPFPNGNGRHARLMADLLIERFGGDAFSWGGRSGSLAETGALRALYLAALQAADNHDIRPLLAFARS